VLGRGDVEEVAHAGRSGAVAFPPDADEGAPRSRLGVGLIIEGRPVREEAVEARDGEDPAHHPRPVLEAAENLAARRAPAGEPGLRERERGPDEAPALGAAPRAKIGVAELVSLPRAIKLRIEPDAHGP